MAVEPMRGCGFRKVGALYLVGEGPTKVCNRLPMHIPVCPICGNTIEFFRGIRRINPLKLFGRCNPGKENCCNDPTCFVCNPPTKGWLMWVGAEFYPTPDDFVNEAMRLGVSKRLPPNIPDDLQPGDKVYLAHPKVFREISKRTGRERWVPGIFYAFTVTRIEKILPESHKNDKKEIEELKKMGITPVFVPDDDPDHRGSVYEDLKKRKTAEKYKLKTLDRFLDLGGDEDGN